jgi:hypothetical protein
MATTDEARQAIIDSVARVSAETNSGYTLNQCAEALAWLKFPNQPHGGSAKHNG